MVTIVNKVSGRSGLNGYPRSDNILYEIVEAVQQLVARGSDHRVLLQQPVDHGLHSRLVFDQPGKRHLLAGMVQRSPKLRR